MNEDHLAGELGEERCFLHRRIATAHYGDLVATEEEAVTRGTRGQPVRQQTLLGVEAEHK